MSIIKETHNGIEIEPFMYNKNGPWKLYLFAYKEARETMLHLRQGEVVELEKTLFDNPEIAEDSQFIEAYNFSKKEVAKEQASIDWADVKISELPKYDPFL